MRDERRLNLVEPPTRAATNASEPPSRESGEMAGTAHTSAVPACRPPKGLGWGGRQAGKSVVRELFYAVPRRTRTTGRGFDTQRRSSLSTSNRQLGFGEADVVRLPQQRPCHGELSWLWTT